MLQKINNKKDYIKGTIFCLLLFVLSFIFLKVTPFGENTICVWDCNIQYIPILTEFSEKIKSGSSLLYSFHGGLGFDFYLTICYYLLSPFSFIALLFNSENMVYAAQIIIVLKMCLINITMIFYLRKKEIKNPVVFSLIYSFCYFFIVYKSNFMWLDSIALFPLILYSLDNIENKKNRILYILFLTLSIIFNFYIGLIICIFITIYFLINLLYSKNIKRKIIYFVSTSILSTIIAAFVLIPSATYLLNNNTANNIEFTSDIFKGIMPFSIMNISLETLKYPMIFSTITILFLIPVYFLNNKINKIEKIKNGIILCVLLSGFLFSIPNFILSGFYNVNGFPFRYAFIFIFFIINITAQATKYIKEINNSKIIISAIIISALLLSIVLIRNMPKIIIPYILFIMFFFVENIRNNKTFIKIIIFEIIFCSLISPITLTTNYQTILEEDNASRSHVEIEAYNNGMIFNINDITTFNSIRDIEIINTLNNMGIYTSSTRYINFSSTNPVASMLLGIDNVDTQNNENIISLNNYKLSIGYNPKKLNFNNNADNKIDSINKLFKNYGTIFENVNCDIDINLIKCEAVNNKIIGNQDSIIEITIDTKEPIFVNFGNLNKSAQIKINEKTTSLEKDTDMLISVNNRTKISFKFVDNFEINKDIYLKTVKINENVLNIAYNDLNKNQVTDVYFEGNIINCNYYSNSNDTIIITVPYSDGWKAISNGKEIEVYKSQASFIELHLNSGENNINLAYKTPYLNQGIAISIIGIFIFLLYLKKEKIKNK